MVMEEEQKKGEEEEEKEDITLTLSRATIAAVAVQR